YCDTIETDADGAVRASGWAVSALGIAAVEIWHEGFCLGEAELGRPRADVAEIFPTIPMARHPGFAFTGRLPAPPDAATALVLRVVNGAGAEEKIGLVPTRRERLAPIAVPAAPAPPDPVAGETFRLELDRPVLADGVMIEPVTSRLTLEGWAVARAGVETLAVYLDGQRLGEVHSGLVRQDVERALPDWPNALRSGFAFHFPPRLLRDGEHRAELVLRAADGTETRRAFAFTVARGEEANETATIRARIDPADRAALARTLDRLAARPAFRLLIQGADPAHPAALDATLASLRAQVLLPWQADIEAADPATARALRAHLATSGAPASVAVRTPGAASPWPPAAADDAALCGILRAGDTLDAAALAEFAAAGALDPEADLLYADESRISPVSGEREPWFKPDFSPALLHAGDYLGRPWLARAALLREAGGFAGDAYDLALRAAERARAVAHLPKLLARRAEDDRPDPEAERAALEAAAAREGQGARIEPGLTAFTWRYRRRPLAGRVSIIIPTNGAGGHVERCLPGLRAHTDGRDIEIVCIENIPDSRASVREFLLREADRVLAAPAAFNWSRFNNLAAAAATGEHLLFLNDDIEILGPGWLEAMLEALADPGVGLVGARLLYPDRTVQHAGMFLAGASTGRHAFRFAAAADPGYFGLSLAPREVSAVTGACMLMRRAHYDGLGGFDETHEVINNDLDFCLRTLEAGKRVIYTPHATLIHHELASRGSLAEDYDLAGFAHRWRTRFAAGDPFFNPNLSTEYDDCRPNDEPIRVIPGGGARLDRAAIARILVVKVDHIGDFISALPAIRRLKATFPEAAIDVLVNPSAIGLARMEPAIAEAIPFAFFHARSALGQVELEREALAALAARLKATGYDLAIDLRKHLDTRELLREAGARWSAGYDHMGQFPWLDVALEWEGDRALHPKRHHITEDLLRLVAAIDLAATERPRPLAPPPSDPLPEAIGARFARPVVCVHPGAGNAMKQWPVGNFAALLGLILARHPVNVLLIGGPDEAEIGAEIEAALDAPDRVGSAIGALKLGALPALLARAALFIGNDSGPKHIAAAVGVPVIGIHSGTVDPTEWGSVGDGTAAVARAMSCAPCYMNRLADCPRALACIRGIDPGVIYRLCRPVLAALTPPLLPARRRRDVVGSGSALPGSHRP
ncbi:MAG: glycosyltransferase, partial [Rhodospirillales bacterium]|nr:glycosyltransferase [Rhodospirillales bacterium]